MRRLLFLTAILLCLTSIARSAGKRCAVCKKIISDGYNTYSYDYIVCDKCAHTAPRCDICNKPSSKLFNTGQRHICATCKSGVVRCQVCNKKLTNDLVQLYSPYMKVCSNCARLQRCTGCGAPSRHLTVIGNAKLCSRCISESNTCRGCGKPLLSGGYRTNSKSNGYYCRDCYLQHSSCTVCKQKAGAAYHEMNDGQIVCRRCWSEMRPVLARAKEISRRVTGYLNSSLNIHLRRSIDFTIKRKEEYSYSGNQQNNYIVNVFNNDKAVNIYLLPSNTEKELYWSIAYGCGNGWYWENCRINYYSRLPEAFSEWVGYKVLLNLGMGDTWDHVNKSHAQFNPIFDHLRDLEKTGGIKAVFDYVKSPTPVPNNRANQTRQPETDKGSSF